MTSEGECLVVSVSPAIVPARQLLMLMVVGADDGGGVAVIAVEAGHDGRQLGGGDGRRRAGRERTGRRQCQLRRRWSCCRSR